MEDNGEHQVELKGPLMWRDPPNQSMSSLPFKIGDLFDMFEQRPLYFTASQVRHWIEYFAPTLREWLKDLAETELYEPFYDLCQCDYKSMWDTLDTMLHLLWKYEDENKPYAGRDAVEHTAFYAGRIARAIAAVGFLFDIPEEDLVAPYDREFTCEIASLRLFLVVMVDLRKNKEGFFSRLVGGTLATPTTIARTFIDNEPGRLNWTGTQMDGNGHGVRLSAVKATKEGI